MTDRLVLPAPVRDALLEHAREGAPEEVCGVLGGDAGDGRPIRVREARRVSNVAADPRTRYELDPGAALAAIDRIEAAGGDHVGFYHSHPRGPAEPSDVDRAEAAWPGHVYCLVVPDRGSDGEDGTGGGDGDANADADAGGGDRPTLVGSVRAWRWTGEAFDPLAVDVEAET